MQRDIVNFQKGAILRKEMLESLYNYPHFLVEGYYSLYSDGILYGLEWFESDGKHYISPGAIKYKGYIYFQSETIVLEDVVNIDDLQGSQEYYVFYKETPVKHSYSQDVYDLVLSLEAEPITDGFCYKYIKYELKRFKSLDYKKIYGLFASPKRDSFSIPNHIIKSEIIPILIEKESKHPLDYEIMRMSCSNEPLPADFVQLYLSEYNRTIKNADEKIKTDISCDNARQLVNCFSEAIKLLAFYAGLSSEETEVKSDLQNKEDDEGCMM